MFASPGMPSASIPRHRFQSHRDEGDSGSPFRGTVTRLVSICDCLGNAEIILSLPGWCVSFSSH